jgi:hypothetical protein
VAKHGGLTAGTVLTIDRTLIDSEPQGHKVTPSNLNEGDAVLRCGIPIGWALKFIPAGSWVHELELKMPQVCGFVDLLLKRHPLSWSHHAEAACRTPMQAPSGGQQQRPRLVTRHSGAIRAQRTA